VLLVIAGTYCLFTAGSIALLKLLRKNKSYYYKTKHFTSVSGMMYRMKQNAVGLANICILSTAVLVMLSTTVSLYLGMEDVLRTRYSRNVIISSSDISDDYIDGVWNTQIMY
jgi:putative ABC transport system permease protein